MEKRDALFVLLVLGGGGYGVWKNWDTIAAKLSISQLDPGRLKSIQLAKDSGDLGGGVTNWQLLQSRKQRHEIEMAGDPWQADPLTGQEYRVTVRWQEDDAAQVATFRVDVARRTVALEGSGADQPAAPR